MTTKQKLEWRQRIVDLCDGDPLAVSMQILFEELLTAQTKLIEEKLKHIPMYHEHGDEQSTMATYSVKDVLDVLAELSK